MTSSWSSPDFAQITELVRRSTGLVFPHARIREVEAVVRRAMARAGIARLDEFHRLLQRDPEVCEELVAELTVGETYFERDEKQIELIRREVLPELLASRRTEQPVRVWSAGCASGEEPYTIAIVFDELGALDRAEIQGTDLARSRLAEARRGVYSNWALRASSEGMRRRYFRRRGAYFELNPRIRERVSFGYLNLAEDSYPSLSTGIWGMDLILCRNVLIYFDRPTVTRVAERLIATLSEEGWLILGASDPPIGEIVACEVVVTEAGLAYRRPGTGTRARFRSEAAVGPEPGRGDAGPAEAPAGVDGAPPAEGAPEPQPEWRVSQGVVAREGGAPDPEVAGAAEGPESGGRDEITTGDVPREPASTRIHGVPGSGESRTGGGDVTTAGPPTSGGPEGASEIIRAYRARDFAAVDRRASRATRLCEAEWLAWLRALANQGRSEDAMRVADRALARLGPSSELLYLQAVVLLAAGEAGAAERAARQALYLDRELVVGHMALGEAQRRRGDLEGARRSLRNAAKLLAARPAEEPVPAADGESAGRLAELIRAKLELLGGAYV